MKNKADMANNDLSTLIKAAYEQPVVSDGLEHRVMVEIARRAIAHSRRRAKLGVVASLSGLAMLLAGCVVVLVGWFPTQIPLLENLHLPHFLDGLAGSADGLPFFEQWGGLLILTLFAGAAAGFIYYLNSLFSSTYIPDDK